MGRTETGGWLPERGLKESANKSENANYVLYKIMVNSYDVCYDHHNRQFVWRFEYCKNIAKVGLQGQEWEAALLSSGVPPSAVLDLYV